MEKHVLSMLFCLSLLFSLTLSAQDNTPQGVSYQSVVRSLDGEILADTDIDVRVTILEEEQNGTPVWQEDHVKTTNEFGLFDLIIGQGFSTGGGSELLFADIDWSANIYFLRIDVDFGDGYEFLGTTQLLSVPYALHARTADFAPDDDADPANESLTEFEIEDFDINITESGNEHTISLQDLFDSYLGVGLIENVQFVNEVVTIITSGGTDFSIDLTSLEEDDDWTINGLDIFKNQGNVGIGTTDPTSTFTINGSESKNAVIVTEDVELDASHNIVLCDVAASNLSVNLPPSADAPGRIYRIKKYESTFLGAVENSVTINAWPSELIDGSSQFILDDFEGEIIELMSDGSAWYVVSYSKVSP